MKLNLDCLKHVAYKLRVGSLKATTAADSGHATTALSAADIVAALYFNVLDFDYSDPESLDNDRFILSKGHGIPVVYAAYKELGLFDESTLLTYRDFDSVLEGHPTLRFRYNEASTGSLGMGLSIGLGMALAARMRDKSSYIYVMLGDSEMTEGSVWEAVHLASYYKTDNLVAIIDVNKLGQSTETIEGYDLDSYKAKFEAFNWHTIVIDGHNMEEILAAFKQVKEHKSDKSRNKPIAIIAKTIKGYGLPTSIAGHQGHHGKAFSKEDLPKLLDYLEKNSPEASRHGCNIPSINFQPMIQENIPSLFEPDNYIKIPESEFSKGDKLATRKAYGEALKVLGYSSDLIISLDAEVKNSTYAEIFEKAHKDRFIQCFVAEQNMIGMAIGFTLRGFIAYSSTFSSFLSRAHDQIRMASIGRVPLRVVGSHAGVSIGQDGPSQMGLEDIAMFRATVNSIVLYPCDAVSTYKLVGIMANYKDGVSYLRTTRMDTPIIYDNSEEFNIGGCKVLRQSHTDHKDDICVIGAGVTLFEALKAYDILKKENIEISVIDLYSIKPLDEKTILSMAKKTGKVITVEDHLLEGGLGEAVCYALRNHDIKIECLAVKKVSRSGKPEELLAYHEIDANAIVKAAKNMLDKK